MAWRRLVALRRAARWPPRSPRWRRSASSSCSSSSSKPAVAVDAVERGQHAERRPRKTSGTSSAVSAPTTPRRRRRRPAAPARRPTRSRSRASSTSPSAVPSRGSRAPSARPSTWPAPPRPRSSSPSASSSDAATRRVDERAGALDDQLEHAVEVGLRRRPRGRSRVVASSPRTARSSSARRLLGLAYRRAFSIAIAAQPASVDRRLLVGLVNGRRRPSRSGRGCPTPRRGSRIGTPRKRAHRRVAGREAVGARVLADVGEAQRPRVVDEHAEHAAAARQVADRRVRLGVDAAGEEALEARARRRRGRRARRTARRSARAPTRAARRARVEVEVGDERLPGVDEAPQGRSSSSAVTAPHGARCGELRDRRCGRGAIERAPRMPLQDARR